MDDRGGTLLLLLFHLSTHASTAVKWVFQKIVSVPVHSTALLHESPFVSRVELFPPAVACARNPSPYADQSPMHVQLT